jgi:hypothetical protein
MGSISRRKSIERSDELLPGLSIRRERGVICSGSTTAAQKVAAENADPCLSLGKGARYCPPAK